MNQLHTMTFSFWKAEVYARDGNHDVHCFSAQSDAEAFIDSRYRQRIEEIGQQTDVKINPQHPKEPRGGGWKCSDVYGYKLEWAQLFPNNMESWRKEYFTCMQLDYEYQIRGDSPPSITITSTAIAKEGE